MRSTTSNEEIGEDVARCIVANNAEDDRLWVVTTQDGYATCDTGSATPSYCDNTDNSYNNDGFNVEVAEDN